MRTLFVLLLLATGCKTKEERKPVERAPASLPAPGPVGSGAVTTDDEYVTKSLDLATKTLAIFSAAGTDCDKLAAEITKFSDEYRATFAELKAYEKAHPDARKKYDDKMKQHEQLLRDTVGPAIGSCQDHAGLKKAIGSLPQN